MANSFPVAQAWIRFASWPAYRRVQTAQSVRAQRDWEQHVFISVFMTDDDQVGVAALASDWSTFP
jgi:hypothetical protein